MYSTTGACDMQARHGHVSLANVRESHNFATPQRLHLLPERVFVHRSRVARGPEVKRRKNQVAFLNRLIGGLPFGLVEFSWDLREV